MEYLYKRRFLEAFDRLSRGDQERVVEADRRIRSFYEARTSAIGLGVRKLYAGRGKVFEGRAGLKLRVVGVEASGVVSFVFVGTHDEVRRFLRSLA